METDVDIEDFLLAPTKVVDINLTSRSANYVLERRAVNAHVLEGHRRKESVKKFPDGHE
jgi:hypothetical protein